MRYNPRNGQDRAIQWALEHPKSGIFASMGIGKSSAMGTVLDIELELGAAKKALILAPLRVAKTTWPDEFAKWDHLQHLGYSVITGTEAQRREAMASKAPIHILNYDNIPWFLNAINRRWPYDRVVADESSKLKAHDAVRFKGTPERREILPSDEAMAAAAEKLLKKGHACRQSHDRKHRPLLITEARMGLIHVARLAKRWTNMTGTCAPNGIQDLWSQTFLLDGGRRLGANITEFRHRFMFPDPYVRNKWLPKEGSLEQVTDAISDLCLTLEAKDYFDLPPLVESTIEIPLPDRVFAQYRELEKEFYLQIERGEVTAANAAVLSGKLRQFTSGFLFLEGGVEYQAMHDAKLDALEDIIDDLNGQPLLVAYHWKPDAQRLKARFPQATVLDKDPETIRRWNRGEIPVLLLNPTSAGHGLNLQDGGNQLVFYSMDWNLEDYQQVIERIGPTRQYQAGYDRPCFIHYLVCPRTIDEDLLQRLYTKAEVQDCIKRRFKKHS